MKRAINIAMMLGLALLYLPSYAALHLELTQGLSGALPIAVIPFAGQSTQANSPNNIASIIHQDLANSGRFKIPEDSQLQQQPHTVKAIDFPYWQRTGTDYVVIGQVKALSGQKYSISFSLVDVFRGSVNNPSAGVLLHKQYTVSKAQLRAAAHTISDAVYQQLTGERGIFSTKIAYVLVKHRANKPTQYSLDVADFDGYNPRPILISNEPIMSPSWSPKGNEIAYVSFEHQRASIYISNIQTGKRQLITSYPGINGAPAFSPDGNKLALVLSKTGYPKIYVKNLVSGKLTQITHGWSIDTEPNWSPNGKSLVFTSNRGGGPQIYQINLASKKISRMTFDGHYNATASYTPNARDLVVLHEQNSRFNIAIQDIASGAMKELTKSGSDSSPTISPNGQMILYAANQSNNHGDLAIVSINGKIRLRIPSPNGNVQEPAWSPYLG